MLGRVRDQVIAALSEEMIAAGWHASNLSGSPITPGDARFYRAAPGGDDRFVATAQFHVGGSRGRGSRAAEPIEVEASLGITVPAVERLLTKLGARHRNAGAERTLGELTGSPDRAVLARPGDDPGAALRPLIAMVNEHVDDVSDLASPARWLSELQGDPDGFDFEIEVVPVALQVFERTDEARRALDRYIQQAPRPSYRTFAEALTRFIESGASVPDSADVSPAVAREKRPRQPPSLGEARDITRKRRAALEELARHGRGKSREERRAILGEALAREGLTESPVWIESRLDAHHPHGLLEFFKLANDLVRGAAQIARGRTPRDPAFLAPPSGALDLSHSGAGRWLAVVLDPDVKPFLREASKRAARRFGESVLVTPWLQRTATHEHGDETLVVSIGQERVGTVRACELQDAFETAATNDGAVCVIGRLTHGVGESGYLLEIDAPQREHSP